MEKMNKKNQKFDETDNIDVREAVAQKQDEIDKLSNDLESETKRLVDSQKTQSELLEENEMLKE